MLNTISGMSALNTLAVVIGGFFALALALGFHEASHAFVAHKCGDMTPKAYGRLTLNPFRHFDMWGTAMLLLVGFGWAKPVPINTNNFKKPRRDLFFVSVAGVLSNLILAFLGTALYLLVAKIQINNFFIEALFYFTYLFVIYNVNFAVFNLLPIYPLDGFNIVVACSKRENGYIRFMKQYGWIVLIVIIILLSRIIFYPTQWILQGFGAFWGLIF